MVEEIKLPKARFTWNISYDCNYRCSYCFFNGRWEEYKKRNIYLSPDEWFQHWKRIYDKYGPVYIIVTGGEPFIYPDFIELIKKLSNISYHINISSNSSGNLNKFVREVSSDKVSLSLSYQPEFDELDNFIERLSFIRKQKFNGCVNFVAYPPFLENLDYYKDELAKIGELLKVIPFFGEYNGRNYPEAYTKEQMQLIGINGSWFKKVKRKGSLCPAGQKTSLIFPDGKVARCGQIGENMVLGSFFDKDFKLLDNPLPCEAEYCPCDEEEIIPIDSDKHDITLTCKDVRDENRVDTELEIIDSNRDIYFTWDIHYKCNFRCPYCWFFKKWARLSERSICLVPDEWLQHWMRIYDKYGSVRIEITGGEPFIYPGFIELVKKLSSIHAIKITTNMSCDTGIFIKEINPERVSLDLNFHPLFIDLDNFLAKAIVLKNTGFNFGVCYLAYPPQMGKIDMLKRRFEEVGIAFSLAAFWGQYRGMKYPDSYTEEQIEFMKPYLGDINRLTYHLNTKSPRGKLCNAGYKYADIQADGNIVRCAPLGEKSIGNILDKKFKLLDKPIPCEADFCPCNEYENIIEDNKLDINIASERIKVVEKDDDISASVKTDIPDDVAMKLPDFPRLAYPYRVHWNWELSYRCNYKCSYCPWWQKADKEKNNFFDTVSIDKWRNIWDGIFNKYWCSHIRFSGGEPTIYPNFFELISMLLEKHTVDITTNLSFDILKFTEKIKPGAISISASFHPEFDKIEAFLEKVLFLHKNGYPSTISYVAYPPHFDKMRYFKSTAENEKIIFKIIPYQGKFNNKKYPQDYTLQEKILMDEISNDSENSHVNKLNMRWNEWNIKKDKAEKSKKGSLCRMGQMYAKICPDGKVVRCCAVDKNGSHVGILGNITDEGLRLLDEPSLCEADSCPCFKSMLVGFEEDKWMPLWEALEHPTFKTEYIKKIIDIDKNNKASSMSSVANNEGASRIEVLDADLTVKAKLLELDRIFFT